MGKNNAFAYVLISTYEKPHSELEAHITSSKDVKVVEIYPLFARWDAIAKLQSDDFNAIGRYVMDIIRRVPGVVSTITLVGYSSLEKKLRQSQQPANPASPQQAQAQQLQ